MTEIYGSNQLTPGGATAPSTLLTGADTETGLLIQCDLSTSPQTALKVVNSSGTTMFEIVLTSTPTVYAIAYNMKIGAASSVFGTPACMNGQQNPPCLELVGARIWGGTGAPGSGTVGTARIGDVYLRRDGAAGTYYYICTAAGTPGTWSGIA
jgi:hypothetical protein